MVSGATVRHDTATSLSMRRSVYFFRWRQLLRELDLDFEYFVREELKEFPLSRAGWEQDTLLALFNLEFAPLELRKQYCCGCSREVYCVYRIEEVWWNAVLDRVKNRRDPHTGKRIQAGPNTIADHPHPDPAAPATDEGEKGDVEASVCSVDSSIQSFFSCAEEWVDEAVEGLWCWKCGLYEVTHGCLANVLGRRCSSVF